MACRVCGATHRNYRTGVCDEHNYTAPWYRRQVELAKKAVFAEESVCRRCGSAERPSLEHLDGDMFNFHRSNLARYCSSCNSKSMHERRRRNRDGVS